MHQGCPGLSATRSDTVAAVSRGYAGPAADEDELDEELARLAFDGIGLTAPDKPEKTESLQGFLAAELPKERERVASDGIDSAWVEDDDGLTIN